MMGVNDIWSDVEAVRSELTDSVADVNEVFSIIPWRPAFDVLFDWMVIYFAANFAFNGHIIAYLVGILAIGNRQRALGDLLHEAGHKNLYKTKLLNDQLAVLFLAPPLTSNLQLYRRSHARHHALLGQIGNDPDLISVDVDKKYAWFKVYLRQIFSIRVWQGAVLGQMADRSLTWNQRLRIGVWWASLFLLLSISRSISFAYFFLILWFLSKATTFHVITVFREMCDHFALRPGGIYSFTRDVVIGKGWRWLIHPHNNGYHLSHHLQPTVPYYRLPMAQKLLSRLPSYARNAVVCDSYFKGRFSVIHYRPREGLHNGPHAT